MTMRLDKLRSGRPACDQKFTVEPQLLYATYGERQQLHREHGLCDAELGPIRWMLDEYRALRFAQTWATSQTVSSQRLEKQWKKVQP